MIYLSEPLTVLGQPLLMRFDCDAAGRRSHRATALAQRASRSHSGQADPLRCSARDDRLEARGRSRVTLILLGDPDAVDQNVIELERRGYCDSYAWTPPLIVRESAPPIQPLPGELMRLYQRWHPLTGLRLPL